MQLEQGFALYRQGPGFTSITFSFPLQILVNRNDINRSRKLVSYGIYDQQKNHSKYTRGVPHTIHTKTTTTVLVRSDDRNRHHQSK